MRINNLWLVFLLVIVAAAAQAAALPVEYQRNAIVVKLRTGMMPARLPQQGGTIHTGLAQIDRLNDIYGCLEFRRAFPAAQKPPFGRDLVGMTDWYFVEFESNVDIAAALAEYEAIDQVIVAQPIGIHEIYQDFPDDPSFDSQWGLYQDPDPYHVHAPSGWVFETGDTAAIFGCMDTGVLWKHSDLRSAIWVNPGEDLDGDGEVWDTTDINGLDDDNNGYVDDLIGWDFVSFGSNAWDGEDYLTPDYNPIDFNGHGTHVAGIAAAVRNNRRGIAGVAGGDKRFGARIMCLRIGWSTNVGGQEGGSVNMYYAAEAFDYAVAHGADVINCSWGNSNTGGFGDAVTNALANGVVVVQAAGNDNDSIPDYMGTIPEVISVAATKLNDGRAGYSDYGSWITVAAPGGDGYYTRWIYATYSDHYTPMYAWLKGTSMASPFVSGLALLLKSHHPEYDRNEIFPLIVDNTDNIDGRNPSYVGLLGSGRINVYNSLSGLTSADFTVDTFLGRPPLTVTFTDASVNVTDGWMYTFGDGGSAAGPNAVHTYQQPGLYDVEYRANGTSGWHTRRKHDHIIVLDDLMDFQDAEIYQGGTGTMPVYLQNSLPTDTIEIAFVKPSWISGDIKLDSIAFGERTSYFAQKQTLYSSGSSGKAAFRLVADAGDSRPPLAPGSGIIAYVWFTVEPDAPLNLHETCDSGLVVVFTNRLMTLWGNYTPDFSPATLTVVGGPKGDADVDGEINPVDVVLFVNYVYKSYGYISVQNGDLDCDGNINPIDVVLIVNRVYKGRPLPYPDFCP